MPPMDSEPKWNDSHCHLDLPPLLGQMRQVITAARERGIGRILVPGVSGAVHLPSTDPGIHRAWGFHPAFLGQLTEADLERLWQECPYEPVAIGECGLDASLDVPLERQERLFRCQARLAREQNLPLLLQGHGFWNEPLTILRREAATVPWIFHAYAGSVDLARIIVAEGGLISLAPPVTKDNARVRRAVACAVPDDAFLLETDAPDMVPQDWPASFADPTALLAVAQVVARLRDQSLVDIRRLQDLNFRRVFGDSPLRAQTADHPANP